jgi:hypothetical protein
MRGRSGASPATIALTCASETARRRSRCCSARSFGSRRLDVLDLVRAVIPAEALATANLDDLAEQIARSLDTDTLHALYHRIESENDLDRFGLFENLFPDETAPGKRFTYFARELYPRHMEHFAAGKIYRERCFMAANQIGKTTAGCLGGRLPPHRPVPQLVARPRLPPPDSRMGRRRHQRDHPRHPAEGAARRDRLSAATARPSTARG